jgi:DNA-binding response OmpR family regulator
MTARIVVVDDDHAILTLLDTLLTEAGYHPIL